MLMKTMCFLGFLSVLTLYTQAQADIDDNYTKAISFEKQLIENYDRMLKSTVLITKGTGVIVSEDGYILTAAHVVEGLIEEFGDSIYTDIQLYDGRELKAKILGRDEINDYALLKIVDEGTWQYSKIGNTDTFGENNICFMLGHPGGREENRPAVLRMGFYELLADNYFFQTTCIMNPGDSGGPLFDIKGEVVGLCSFNNIKTEFNFYTNIGYVKRNWHKLLAGEVFNILSSLDYESSSGHGLYTPRIKNEVNAIDGGSKGFKEVFNKLKNETAHSIVLVRSNKNKQKSLVSGSIIHSDGYIVAKSSIVGNENIECYLPDKEWVEAKVIHRFIENDLALIKVEKNNLKPLNMSFQDQLKPGDFVATIDYKDSIRYAGVVGVQTRKIPEKSPPYGFLGLKFKDGLEVEQVVGYSPAYNVGVKKGDRLLKMGQDSIADLQSFYKWMEATKPNQIISFSLERDGEELNFDATLIKNTFWRPRFKNGKNGHNWADGLSAVFTHDMPLVYDDAGTPVINLDGDVVGINIAKENRTCSFAIPIYEVKKLLDTYLQKHETDK